MNNPEKNLADDFNQLWEEIEPLKFKDAKWNPTSEYEINEALSRYLHLSTILDLFYHSKYGDPRDQRTPTDTDYTFEMGGEGR